MTLDQALLNDGKISVELSLGQLASLVDTCPDYTKDILEALVKIWAKQQRSDSQPLVYAELTVYIEDELRDFARPIIEG